LGILALLQINIMKMENTKFTYEAAVKKIDLIGGVPIVVEAQWDGDSRGWFLMMFVIIRAEISEKLETYHLGNISLGGDIRLFQGTVPPYPEAALAEEIGNKLKEKYNLEFFFPSPINPDDNCPRWTEKDKAISCQDCNKLIIPTNSPYLPKEICYNCHLKREQNQRIINEERYDDGVTMYLFKNEEFHNLGYCSKFESFPIAPFLKDKVDNQKFDDVINIVTLQKSDIVKLIQDLENEIDKQILEYEEPQMDKRLSKFVSVTNVEYKGRAYKLMNRFNSKHELLSRLISSLDVAIKAREENYGYKIYFKNGITHRDDSVLRFVNYSQEGKTDINTINKRYEGILSTFQVEETLKKLEKIGCLTVNVSEVEITENGKNIV
jgi:hypothetical protein